MVVAVILSGLVSLLSANLAYKFFLEAYYSDNK
jgi:hypothetical protein